MNAPSLSLAGPAGTVRLPRAWVRDLLQLEDHDAALVGLALAAIAHPDAVITGDGDEAVRLEPGECLVSVHRLASLVGRAYYPTATERALRALVEADVIKVRDLAGEPSDDHSPDRLLVITVKGWGDYRRPA